MNAFLKAVGARARAGSDAGIRRGGLATLQVNMGNLCNQDCAHCHVGASPRGTRIMPKKVIDDVLALLAREPGIVLDITGGAPELNPRFEDFVRAADPLAKEIIVRSNLTVFFEPGKEDLPRFLAGNGVYLICSLPCYTKENVEGQRGRGVFEKSINALRVLNTLGYGVDGSLRLDLVYNPGGAFLPMNPDDLERDYKRVLKKDYGIVFNRLITITNVPIKRFRKYLYARGEFDDYFTLLMNSFNPGVVKNLMCRTLLSVGHDGRLFDCDFNQALGMELADSDGDAIMVGDIEIHALEGRRIAVGEHCFACTAGCGSSCQGALA